MRNLTIILSFLISFGTNAQVTGSEFIVHYNENQINTVLNSFGITSNLVSAIYEVDFYRVTYMTQHPNGEMVEVSGALCVPSDANCPLPISSYQHGTIGSRAEAPSFVSGEAMLGVIFASGGYITCMPDYIGLGQSELLHLYVHADSEASASLDMIRATRDLQEDLGFEWNEELFLWGYSQGGHATAALQRLIELDESNEFEITGSAPMSGPYDISGAQAAVITADQVYPTPGYLPYVVLSYQEVYGNIYTDLEEIFLPEYAAIIPDLFDGTNTMGYINNQFPDVPNQMLQPNLLEAFQSDPNHPLRIALADNDVMDWAPQVPTQLFFCEGDDQVNYMNSLNAYDAFQNLGSTSVLLSDFGNYDHGACAPIAILAGYYFFESLRTPVFNPQVSAIVEDITDIAGSVYVNVVFPQGNYTFEWSNGWEELDLVAFEPGEYTLTLTDDAGCSQSYTFTVGVDLAVSELSENQNFKVFPNPANDLVQVQLNKTEKIMIYDISGRLLFTQKIAEQGTINTSDLSEGVYFLQTESGLKRMIQIIR